MDANRITKTCSVCQTAMPMSAFSFQHGKPRSQCKRCRAKYEFNRRRTAGYKARHPDRAAAYDRARKLRIKFGMTPEEFDAMLSSQGNACALCRSRDPNWSYGVFVVDHCHQTGRVRGILCHRCNAGLGALGDTPAALRRALKYVCGGSNG